MTRAHTITNYTLNITSPVLNDFTSHQTFMHRKIFIYITGEICKFIYILVVMYKHIMHHDSKFDMICSFCIIIYEFQLFYLLVDRGSLDLVK